MLLTAEVTCYAGASYPGRPRAFLYHGQRLEVAEVVRRERTPRELRFHVRIADGRQFWLIYAQDADVWEVRLSRRPPKQGDSA